MNSKSLIVHSLPVWARTYLTVPVVQARDELKTAYAFVATHYGMDIGTPFAHLNAQDERNDYEGAVCREMILRHNLWRWVRCGVVLA